MERETTRRALLGALVGAGVTGGLVSPVGQYLDQFAPLSGSVWGSVNAGKQDSVESPYGSAQLRHDEMGVAHVSADDEQALYFAVGYAQAADRLFQMDLQRRLFRGQLSAVVGDTTLGSDRFHRKMAFADAAEATAEHLQGSAVEPALVAYRDGVNAAREEESLPLECRLLDYEPDSWTIADTVLIEKIIAWQLTGSFRTLKRALVREEFDEEMADRVFQAEYDDVIPILRDGQGPETFGDSLDSPTAASASGDPVDGSFLGAVERFEPVAQLGSNSWVVSPDIAGGDAPIVSNDPHLGLQAPPVWYEMQIDGPMHRARGVSFPGTPFVVIGENDDGAWGFTNVGADVMDFYRYDRDGDTYQYGDEEREFEVDRQTIEVSGGENETVEVRKSVHGPVIEEHEQEVGVAWTGHTATETTLALYQVSHSEGLNDVRDAVEQFDSPTQNFVYGDRDGNTLYQMVGRIPIRRTDGEVVRGDQIFDGSAREGEWEGFEPFGASSWDGFVPVSEHPHVENPDYVATANQQTVALDRLGYYLGVEYADPYRGRRIYGLLDERVESGDTLDLDYLRTVGRDVYDGRAADFVPDLVAAARESDDDALVEAADLLDDWDYRMEPDSEAALLFDLWTGHYREQVFGPLYEAVDLSESSQPTPATIAQFGDDSPWFDEVGREEAMRTALSETLDERDEEGYETYGDLNHTGHIGHPLGLDFLSYPSHERGGSGWTVRNYSWNGSWGGSWEMQADLDGPLLGVLPGGNSGHYFSEHYDDQIERWANGEYRQLSREIEGELTTEFREEES
jgi:penicillin amidase